MFWTTELCHSLMPVACEKAKAMNLKGISLAIYDKHGLMVMFHRMGRAPVVSGKFACAKAYTAALIGKPTKELAAFSKKETGDLPAFQCMDPNFTLLAGGYPVIWKGKLVGGIGISGGTGDEDCKVCESVVRYVLDYCKKNPPQKCSTK